MFKQEIYIPWVRRLRFHKGARSPCVDPQLLLAVFPYGCARESAPLLDTKSYVELRAETTALLEHFRHLASTASSLDELQTCLVAAMAAQLTHYSWTGFYMLIAVAPDTLVLGAFVGDPTQHVRIPVSQGIFGAAVAKGLTLMM